jgi:hypothetical protein
LSDSVANSDGVVKLQPIRRKTESFDRYRWHEDEMARYSKSMKVSDNRLILLRQALHADWFNGRVHRRLNIFDGWHADIWIHDAGHAVIFSNKTVSMTEIMTGMSQEMPQDRIIWQRTPLDEELATIQPGGRLEYQINYELEVAEPSIFRFISQEMLLKPTPHSICWQSDGHHRLQESPIIRVNFDPGPGYLSIQSFHTFPNESAILRTQSLFEIH